MKLVRKIPLRLAQTTIIQRVAQEQVRFADLKRKPSLRLSVAIGMVCLSYITCWPVIGLLGAVAVKLGQPLIFSIGSPTAYIFSHLLLLAGMLVAGSEGAAYLKTFGRWLVRVLFLRFICPTQRCSIRHSN